MLEDETLPVALRCGINLFDFWEMTFKEVQMVVDAYADNRKNRNNDIYNIAFLISNFVGSVLSGKEVPAIEEVFPTEENLKAREQYEVQKFKSQMQSFAIAHNKRGDK